MVSNRKRITAEGFGFGLIAGVIVLGAEIVASAVATGMPGAPLRSWASLVLGFHALDSSLGTTFLIGLVVELVASGLLGVAYSQFEWLLPAEARRHYGWQFGMGTVYAALAWIAGLALAVGTGVFPWLATMTPLRELVIQSLFYGGALGLMFAAAERRTPLVVTPSFG